MYRFFLVFFFLPAILQAQHVSFVFQDISFAEALQQLNEQSKEYSVNFMYDELEDFHVTTTIKRKTIPEAIRQLIGFYPIRMTVDTDKNIYVECTHKTDRHLTGTVINENGEPVVYANIVLLHPVDSSVVGGGVSNESGVFVIPYEHPQVIARISYIGYKTVYQLCSQEDIGIIRMQHNTVKLDGVTVKGDIPIVKAENGHLVYNMPQLLEQLPADDAYEALTRIPGVMDSGEDLTFCGQTVTLIINGKPTTLSADHVKERLKEMPASQLAKAEVLPSAPAKYHVRGMAINIVTKDYTGSHQLLGQLRGLYRQNKYGYGKLKGSIIFQNGKFGLDAYYDFGYGDAYGKVKHEARHPLGNQRIDYSDHTERTSRNISHNYRIGMDYAFTDNHRLNLAYTGEWLSTDGINISTGLEKAVQHSLLHNYIHNVDAGYYLPFGLELNVSYTNYQNPRTQHLESKLYDRQRNLTAENNQHISKWQFTADQTHTFKKGWQLNYGIEAQLTDNNSYQMTLNFNGQTLPDATSRVNYNERILNAYAGFSKQFSPSLSLESSIAAEQYHAPRWNDWRIYPSLSLMWNINKQNLLNMALSSQTVYPSYWSTMSSIFYSSAYSEIWGNPDLKPSSIYKFDLMWQLSQRYTFGTFVSLQPDFTVQLAYQPSDRMAVVMKETNFNYSNLIGVYASARFNAGQWLNGNVNLTGLYRHDKSDYFFDLPFNRRHLSLILGGNIASKLLKRHNLMLMLSPFVQSSAIQGVYDIEAFFRLNSSLRWTSNDGQWSLTISGDNLTNSHIKTRSRLKNQDYSMRLWLVIPNVTLTAIYRIGGYKEKKHKEVDTSRMGY